MRGLTLLLAAAAASAADLPWIRTAPAGDAHFYDSLGRTRLFHGANRVQKAAPWYFDEMLSSDAEFELMKSLGFNAMRLGFMWSGYNPAPGVFNETYLEVIQQIVAKMADHGVYALLDMHQDCFSSSFCLYDGIPLWVANKSTPAHAFPWPFQGDCASRGWGENCLTEAAATAYQDLYDNTNGMLDDLAAFWGRAAAAFADTPSVLGYETMNEPFAGDFYAEPSLLLPGVAGRRNLQRLHDAVAAAIRAHDERHVIFYEPVTWGMVFDGQVAGSGFEHVPGGAAWQNASAMSFHYYCSSFVPDHEDKPILTRLVCDDTIGPLVMRAVHDDIARLGGAAMMTEGALGGEDDDEGPFVLDALDGALFGWTDYDDSQGATWAPSDARRVAWARTYARAIAGAPVNMTFDPTSKAFEVCYTLDLAVAAPTEIFASVVYSYPSAGEGEGESEGEGEGGGGGGGGGAGRQLASTPNLVVAGADDDADLVRATPAPGAASGELGCVWITRAGL